MIIDSWGKIIANAEKETGMIIAELDQKKINQDREFLPALKNRKR
jgi:predicted amidohydrolase